LSAQEFSPAPFLGAGKTALAQKGIYSLSANTSGIAQLRRTEVAVSYQQHFVKTDIASQAILLGIPLKSQGAIGLSLTNYGIFGVSSFLRGGLTYARAFGSQFLTSITANYHQYQVTNYHTSKAFSADLGVQYLWSERFHIGAFFRNISQSAFPTTLDQRIARELGLGLCYYLSEELTLGGDVLKEFPHRLVYRGGLSYAFDTRFVLRGGATSTPVQYTAGAGFVAKDWQFDFASSFHSKLGTSPQLSVRYAF